MLEIELETRHVQLTQGVRNANHTWRERTSTLLRLEHGGQTGLGEATPLPGFSSDTWHVADAELRTLSASDLRKVLDTQHIEDALERTAVFGLTAPSARFAVDTAVLNWFAQRRETSVTELLLASSLAHGGRRPAPRTLRVAELLTLDVDAAPAPVAAGCYKFKFGRDVQRELELLERWRAANPAPTQLRIDCNRSLAPASVQSLLARLASLQPEFVEEPCQLPELGPPRALPVKLAFDESLHQPSTKPLVEAWLAAGAVGALVLKPMVIGGIKELLPWMTLAQNHGAAMVFSHLFDGAVAGALYGHLSRAFGSEDVAMGLGVQPGLVLWALEQEQQLQPARLVTGGRS